MRENITPFQREFQVKQSYNFDYIKEAIQKHFLDGEGRVCSSVSVGLERSIEEIVSPTKEDLFRPFEAIAISGRNRSSDDKAQVLEELGSASSGLKFSLTLFKYENGNYTCFEKTSN